MFSSHCQEVPPGPTLSTIVILNSCTAVMPHPCAYYTPKLDSSQRRPSNWWAGPFDMDHRLSDVISLIQREVPSLLPTFPALSQEWPFSPRFSPGFFSCWIVLGYFSLILNLMLLSENMLCVISVISYKLRLVLCSHIWLVVVKIYTLEKNIFWVSPILNYFSE